MSKYPAGSCASEAVAGRVAAKDWESRETRAVARYVASLEMAVFADAGGGISTDAAGFGIGALLDSDRIAGRARDAYEGRPVPRGVVA